MKPEGEKDGTGISVGKWQCRPQALRQSPSRHLFVFNLHELHSESNLSIPLPVKLEKSAGGYTGASGANSL